MPNEPQNPISEENSIPQGPPSIRLRSGPNGEAHGAHRA